MSNFKAYVILGLLLTGISAPAAMAEILVAPTRVVLENGERSSELVLVNKGTEPAAYRIDVLNRRMLVDGTMEDAGEPREGESFAKDFIRYTPRRVVLEPGSKQTVRISAQTSDLEPGEYRSHLRLQSAPLSAGRTLKAAQKSAQGDGISIQLIAIRSITIPIIARIGALDAEVDLENARVEDSGVDGESLLSVRLTRTGTKSTFGDIHIYKDGVADPVYVARGIAIYTPNTERDVLLGLPDTVRGALRGESVRIAYVSSNLQNPETFAELRTVIH